MDYETNCCCHGNVNLQVNNRAEEVELEPNHSCISSSFMTATRATAHPWAPCKCPWESECLWWACLRVHRWHELRGVGAAIHFQSQALLQPSAPSSHFHFPFRNMQSFLRTFSHKVELHFCCWPAAGIKVIVCLPPPPTWNWVNFLGVPPFVPLSILLHFGH